MHDLTQRTLWCYRLDYRSGLDEELVWALVQQYGGHISTTPLYIDFWPAPEWAVILVMVFPDLARRPEGDYL